MEQVRGQEEASAVRETFSGPLSARSRRIEVQEREPRRVRDPAWPVYSEQFYERRWLLPVLAAGLDPLLGLHALETLSLLFYVAVGPSLFLLLRRRFSWGASFAVSAAVLALPPLRDWAVYPLTDSAGLAFLTAGLLCAVLALERGPRWLLPWFGCVVALSLTRDTAFLLMLAAGVLALMVRDRRTLALALTAAAGALPAPLLLGGPGIREQLAYVFEDHLIPSDTSWGFVAEQYLPNLETVAGRYLDYVAAYPHVVLFFLVGIALLFALGPRRDPFFTLLRASLIGYVLLLVIAPAFSIFRYELVLVPAAAGGIAIAAEWLAEWLGVRLRARRSRAAARADLPA